MTSFWLVPVASIAVTLTAMWFLGRLFGGKATPVDANDPLMLGAYVQARETVDVMRQIFQTPRDVAVKFSLQNAHGEMEHVWGEVVSMDADTVGARIFTPLIHGATPSGPVVVALAEIEDWQATLEDGRIRGGFTTRAQIAIARREGHPIPVEILAQEKSFVDD